MARQLHLVLSFMPEYDPTRPKLISHAAFTNQETAELFRDKVNEDLTEDEEHAFVLSRYFSTLHPEDFEDKACFLVQMEMDQEGRIQDDSIKAETCPVMDTDSTVTWYNNDDGTWSCQWRGWGTSPTEAAKRAKIKCIALKPIP